MIDFLLGLYFAGLALRGWLRGLVREAMDLAGLVLGIVIFWSVLERAGIPDKLTDFLIEITLLEEGSRPFANTEQFLRFVIFGSVVWWVLMTGITTAMAIVYNLVSDVVGGLEVVVLEETLNPVVVNPQPVLHPPVDYRDGNGAITPPEDQADILQRFAKVIEKTREVTS